MSGTQLFAALGIDVNKIRILARHSGETIMRYAQDAPLKSSRSDLGLTPHGTVPAKFATASRGSDTINQRRLHALTDAMGRLEALVNEQADEIASIRALATAEPSPQYVQHDVTATVHRLRPGDASRSICGIATAGATCRARRQDKKTSVPSTR